MASLNRIYVHLRRLLRQPIDELTRAQRMLRLMVDLGRHGWRQLQRDRATEMAAALTYRLIFSLIPIGVLSLLVFRMFVELDDARRWLREITYDYLGWSSIKLPSSAPPVETGRVKESAPETAAPASGDRAPATDPMSSPANGAETPPSASDPSGDKLPQPVPLRNGESGGARPPPGDQAVTNTYGNQPPPPQTDARPAESSPNSADSGTASAAVAASSAAGRQQWQESVDERIDELITKAWRANLGNVGVIGAALFLWAAIGLMVTIEDSFNIILNCPTGRRWYQRLTTYWAFITLGPALLFVSLWAADHVVRWSSEGWELGPYNSLVALAMTRITSLAASWLLLFVMYVLVPNTSVRMKPALFGSFLAAVLWEFAKSGFRWYVNTALPYSALYGSLGLIPLFLFWLYLTWLIVLFGLEVTATLQALRGWRLEEEEALRYKDRLLCDPLWLIPLLATVGQAFFKGRTVYGEELARRMRLPLHAVLGMCEQLRRSGFLHQVQPRPTAPMGFVLARPPERISLKRLLELGQTLAVSNQRQLRNEPGWWFLDKLMAAQQACAEDVSLADVLAHAPPANDESQATAAADNKPPEKKSEAAQAPGGETKKSPAGRA